MKLLALLFIFITFSTHPIFAQKQTLRISTFLAYHSEHFLGVKNRLRSSDKGISKFNIKHDTVNLASQLALNYDEYNNFTLDGSYFQYTKGIAIVGVGKVDRHWSFSKNTSLILSNNARPSESIYLKLDNRLGYDWSPSKANWSLEVFNGFTDGSLNGSKSMLLGMRAILSPFEGLDFELIQTSQWGGNDYNNGISPLGAALFFDTNDSSNKNINKMAGFGISYLIPSHIMPLRIYGQAIGEDEAGNLPSCFAYLAGLEWTNSKIKYPTIVGIEAIDTRIDKTTNGNCGPNSLYNNTTYDYTSYGKTMGTAIDTEGTSLALYVRSQISQKINIEFVTKSVVINDNNWSGHRLSTKRQSGLINSLGVSLVKNNISFNGDIYYQGFNLDKANIKSGYGVGFSSSIIF
ncbi:capsule assembly Wzi family protein [Amylibacter sp.]|nr:capsule assembly Wzi family protein [Amylibacter sp.]